MVCRREASYLYSMQIFQKRFGVITGFFLLFVVLTVNAIVTQQQLSVQVEDQRWVVHTEQVLMQLILTESLLREAESGQRGFLFTGDDRYLTQYDRVKSRVSPNLDKLSAMVADNASQVARVAAMRSNADRKMAELAQTIALYRAGKTSESKALVTTGLGLTLMESIHEQVREIRREEERLQALRATTYADSQRRTVLSIYLASLIAVFGLILLAYYILREINTRERHERQVLEREEWFRSTLTSLGDGVIATDQTGVVTFLNPIAEDLTGWKVDDAKGLPVAEAFPIFNEYTHHPVENPVSKVLELGNIIGLANHTVLRHRNGMFTPIEDSAAPIRDDRGRIVGVVLVFRDASKERKSQEILRKTEKLAAAARLSATFAHEINNPLAAVVNLVYLVKGMPDLPQSAHAPLEMVEHELDRVSHITRQTLGFYRESAVPGRVEIPTLIENILRLYSSKLKAKNIHLEREFQDCPPVQGLAGELTQAISNLISNAADAAPQDGTVIVSLAPIEDAGRRWVELQVKDSGPGIPAEIEPRIFEPFFTTKTDIGTGLGLWVTKEIVDRHGGRIEARRGSAQDGVATGAVFRITLPAAPVQG